MKTTHVTFALIISVTMVLILTLAIGCYNLIGESPFICIPLALPIFPFAWVADFFRISYDAPTNWPVILIGSFITWFFIGLIIKVLFSKIYKH